MKKFFKEIIIILIQIFAFYLLPMKMLNIDVLRMIFSILFVTFILSIVIVIISNNKIKYCYPIIVSLLFIPTVFIYYNESAFVHCLWYLAVSSLGLLIGVFIRLIIVKVVYIVCAK